MANKDFKGFKKDEDTYNCYDPTARSSINSLTPRVGIAEGKITTLQEQMLSVEDDLDALGTASAKNSTSVVTESSDLVESGAVCRAIGIDFKNLIGIKGGWSERGVIEPTANAIRSDKFAVNEGDTFIASKKSALTSTWSIMFAILFDGSGTFIRQESVLGYDTLVDTPYTIPSGVGYVAFSLYVNVADFANITAFEIQVEHGSTATAYEPYHASVEESKCDNSVIGTVENGTTASQAYAVREHFIRNGAFCTVTQAISSGGTLTEGTNYTSGDVAGCLLKKKTITATSSSSGSIKIDSNVIAVTCAYCTTDGNIICMPFIYENSTYLHLRNRSVASSWTPVTEESVTIDVYYFD